MLLLLGGLKRRAAGPCALAASGSYTELRLSYGFVTATLDGRDREPCPAPPPPVLQFCPPSRFQSPNSTCSSRTDGHLAFSFVSATFAPKGTLVCLQEVCPLASQPLLPRPAYLDTTPPSLLHPTAALLTQHQLLPVPNPPSRRLV